MRRSKTVLSIGEPKTGTSAIHKYLDSHPKIEMNEEKGSTKFATDLLESSGDITTESHFNLGSEALYVGDSPAHAAYSEEAAKNIAEFDESAKIIYGIREPVSFLKSYFLQMKKNFLETAETLPEALEKETSRKEGRHLPNEVETPSKLFYSERIRYSEHLQRYLDQFPPDQIYVYVFEDFKDNNQRILNDIFEFLDVKPIQVERQECNKKKSVNVQWLRKLFLRKGIIQNWLRQILPMKARIQAGKVIDYFTLQDPKIRISQTYKDNLRRRFKPEVKKINDILRDHNLIEYNLLRRWGYD